MAELNKKFMASTLYDLLAVLLLLLHLAGCANIIAPEGGPRDETAPQIDSSRTTPNFQTNFEKQPIVLTFDEWIVLEDVFNQVVVSPPLANRPEIRIRRRSVIFEFHEEERLREDATYTVNFGEAVKDLNEKNPAEDLRFVFSTGDQLDSLTFNGQIVDALTNEPVEDVWLMLYDNLADSVVRTERPFYFAKTDENGNARIENVKADTFKVAALVDVNANYRFDQPNEQFAFLDSLFILSDTSATRVSLLLFQERAPLALREVNAEEFGIIKLVFNQSPHEVDVTSSVPDIEFIEEIDKDTLKLWYANAPEQAWKLFIPIDTSRTDTTTIQLLDKEAFVTEHALRVLANKGITRYNPSSPITLSFNHPLVSWDTSAIALLEDTISKKVQPTIALDSTNLRNLKFQFSWKEGVPYALEIFPGGIKDIYNLSNKDTVKLAYTAQQKKDFGNINLTVNGLDSSAHYVLQLIGSNDQPIRTYDFTGSDTFSKNIRALRPGQFKIKIIYDRNNNGRWDTGNYDLGLQPEKIFLRELEQLRANWDLEVEIEL